MTRICNIAPYFTALSRRMEYCATRPSLFQQQAGELAAALAQDGDLDHALALAHRAERLSTIFNVGLADDKAFAQAFAATAMLSWSDYQEPPVDRALQDKLADQLYFQFTPAPTDGAYFLFGEKARYLGRRLVEKCLADNVPFDIQFEGMSDSNFGRLIYNHIDEAGLQALADDSIARYSRATKRISCNGVSTTETLIPYDSSKSARFAELTKSVSERIGSGELDFALTKIPTEKDAVKDNIPYPDYIRLFFELCDQPWDHIDRAHRVLIAILDQGDLLRFTSADGTDLSMSLTDHDGRPFTFCNSLVARNVPGSEVFSAPRRDSVEGVMVAKGQFEFASGKTIRDLTLHFEKGKLVRFEAADGAGFFQEFLDRDPGNFYTGEIGIGTNPHLKIHVINGLLVEKIGGSFHLALGRAYTQTSYAGLPVHIDNGNDSRDHWDVTAMLNNQGMMTLDGQVLMRDGKFTDPRLAVLNQGWAAVSVDERPQYWKNFAGY